MTATEATTKTTGQDAPALPNLSDVKDAAARLAGRIKRTPLIKGEKISALTGAEIWLKLENLQYTGSFKERGALNKLLLLSEEERARGVIAASAGNHAQGVAYHARALGVRAIIVMPTTTPDVKIRETAALGAEVILHGMSFDEANAHARALQEERGLVYVHPFDDPDVIAGQGSIALEMIEDLPEPDGFDAMIIPIGGGGLIAGMAVAAKHIKPEIEIVGAQAEMFDAVKANREKRASPQGGATLAEGIAVKAPSKANMKIIEKLVDRIDSADEAEIEDAVFDLLSAEKLVVEGAPGAGLAVIKKNLKHYKGKKVGLLICGGNIDSRLLSTLIRQSCAPMLVWLTRFSHQKILRRTFQTRQIVHMRGGSIYLVVLLQRLRMEKTSMRSS